ncbi:hypothetical protein ACFQ80_01565 [Isoptericola sp. NPDC056578]|uniref:hypothetical protein n=1 Tax=Isoptericola sp. NPDC056578 TaxID=3345870 RepID=UPI003694EB45
MPPIDVVLHTDSGFWSTWAPPLVAAASAVLVAVSSLAGVLAASLITAWQSRRASERNAQAMLAASERSAKALRDVENARTQTEHVRHLQELIADVASTCAAYIGASLAEFRDDLDTSEVHMSRQRFERAIALVRLASSHAALVSAIHDIEAALERLDEARYKNLENQGVGMPLSVAAALLIDNDGLQDKCSALVSTAASVLAEPLSRTPEA